MIQYDPFKQGYWGNTGSTFIDSAPCKIFNYQKKWKQSKSCKEKILKCI